MRGGRDFFYEAELYRLQGMLLSVLSEDRRTEAETLYRYALDVARRQRARSLELRAAMSLSQLWQQQGKPDKVRQLLTPLYGWFTEGHDTADVTAARVLLAELAT
jgi:predicted ATPase